MFVEPRKFRGVNFSVRGIVYPTVVQTERLSPACTVESPGVLVKLQIQFHWSGMGPEILHF